jgi:hypothetical protein
MNHGFDMWPFTRKTICERRGWHDWNELAFSSARVQPLNGSRCLACPAVYTAPPRPPPKVSDRIEALQFFLRNHSEIELAAARYPFYGTVGTYIFFLDSRYSLDDAITDLWAGL